MEEMYKESEVNKIKNNKVLKLFGYKYGWAIKFPEDKDIEKVKTWCIKNCKYEFAIKTDNTEIYKPRNKNMPITTDNYNALMILFKSIDDHELFENQWN